MVPCVACCVVLVTLDSVVSGERDYLQTTTKRFVQAGANEELRGESCRGRSKSGRRSISW